MEVDVLGNYIIVQLNMCGLNILLLNIYSPNTDKPEFYEEIKDKIDNADFDHVIICGDLNLFLDQNLDCDKYINISNPKARGKVKSSMNTFDLRDIFRERHPEIRHYTWRRRNPFKQARLDYFLISNNLTDMISKADIIPGYRSDHSIIELNITTCKFTRGRGLWKLNTTLLKDTDYLALINQTIDTEIANYVLPVYNINKLKDFEKDIELTIKDDLFLEVLLMKIRGETIKYSAKIKQSTQAEEKKLIADIQKLQSVVSNANTMTLLQNKQKQLENIRKEYLRGHMVRARVQYLNESEKPIKFFCQLEKKNYQIKTIKSIQLNNGSIIKYQETILETVANFYTNLFSKKNVEDIELPNLIEEKVIQKLSDIESQNLEGKLTTEELGHALKTMKNGKTPGIDGFPAEFFKSFLG